MFNKQKNNASLLLATVASLIVFSSEQRAFAAGPIRQSLPIVAGTKLTYSGHRDCTAGLVLRWTGTLSNLTPYQRAVRYVLTAGHCGGVNTEVKVADISVGKVIWKSGKHDLALIRVEPSATRHAVCSAPSTGMSCSIAVDYTPRAVNQIILPSLRTRSEGLVRVTGTGAPSTNEVFCTSGAVTGVICTWGKEHVTGWAHPIENDTFRYAETYGSNIVQGDSGGPVASTSGKVYGIIAEFGRPETHSATSMRYHSLDQFFSEQHGYALAPTN